MKCEHRDVIRVIEKHDIFAILESWLDPEDACPKIKDYVNFRSERKKKQKAKRNSGGIIIYCHKTVSKGIRKIKSSSQDILWLELDRLYFGLPNTLYICVAYFPPDSSVYARDVDIFHDFTNEIDQYSTQGSVAIIGDLNARIGVKNESRITLNIDQDISVPGLVSKSELPSRNSEDITVNSRGRKLLNLKTNHDLLLANGRICGDLRGKHTCCQWNGSSVVDMF